MRKFLLLSTLLIISQLSSQWTQTDGPYGGDAGEIVMVGSDFVLSTGNGGIYRSTNNGNSWQLSNNGLPTDRGVSVLDEENGFLYAAVFERGIYKSTDGGQNWFPINSGDTDGAYYAMAVSGTQIFAGDANGGITYSLNDGNNWTSATGVVSSLRFEAFTFFNSKVYAAGNTLYESSDNGSSWSEIVIPGLAPFGIRSMTGASGVLYVATSDGRVFTSSGDLTSWVQTPLNAGGTIISIKSINGRVYALTGSGTYYYTDDGGLSWTMVQNTNTDRFVNDLIFVGSKTIMTTSEGLFESLDSGSGWNLNNTGILALNIKALHADGATIYAGTSIQGIYRSLDDGANWSRLNNGLDALNAKSILQIIEANGTIFSATGSGIYSFDITSNTWTQKLDPPVRVASEARSNGPIRAAHGSH